MDREAVLAWLKDHPAAVHGDPTQLMERFEKEVRRHAEQHAWRAAKAHVDDRMHEWEQQWGYHSSEAYAAKQVCPELARELKRMEPHFEKGDEPQLVGEGLFGTLEPDARILVGDWIREVANDVEHRIWQQVVQYTQDRGRGLVREGRVSEDTNWDRTAAFQQQAARVAKILVDELEAHTPPDA
ncbi:MAG: hypothetical protein JRG85_10265 [Deltaproteobacteria bacterium]|nr:hypothetical protein [Deltaproteobacteria bacterium]